MKSICFVTTGDIKDIATAKRALGLANPLTDLGWKVSIIMEDTEENRHRVALECGNGIEVFFLSYTSAWDEKQKKTSLLAQIKPDYVYLCAFVFRNIVRTRFQCKRLVEHSELQSAIRDVKWWRRFYVSLNEYYSIIYSDGILNASRYLQRIYTQRAKSFWHTHTPMLYFPYAYQGAVCRISPRSQSVALKKSKNDIYVTYLGSLSKAYRSMDIVKACQKIDDLPVKILLLGRGDDFFHIKQYVSDNLLQDKVWMPGYVNEEEIAIYFSMTDVFVLPMNDTIQDWARCPSKLYMYLPYKKPIITSKVGEPYEVLRDEGVYYQPGSVESLANAIRTAIVKQKITIEAEAYEWRQRALDFDAWIGDTFE